MISWRVIGARVTGTSHQRNGRGCDDYFGVRSLANGTLLLAVADGAGSAPQGAIGAELSVDAALHVLEDTISSRGEPVSEHDWTGCLIFALEAARQEIARAAENLATPNETDGTDSLPTFVDVPPIDNFATTLLLACLTPEWDAFLQLGDGAIVMETIDGTLDCPITPSPHSQYVNVTHFVTDTDYSDHVQVVAQYQPEIRSIGVMTDGLQRLAIDRKNAEPFAGFFRPLFAYVGKSDANDIELQAFLESERVCERTDDDKTLVLATRHEI